MNPLKVSNPVLLFTRLPAVVPPSLSEPLKVPFRTVNAVDSNVNVPAPNSVSTVTPLLNRFTNPSAVNTVLFESNEPTSEFNVAPALTPTTVPVNVPPEASVNVPALTLVVPV